MLIHQPWTAVAGLRRGELFALRWWDFDEGNRTLQVRTAVYEGVFDDPKTIAEVKAELENRGHHIPITHLSNPLQNLTKERVLRRQKVKKGNKQVFSYSKW